MTYTIDNWTLKELEDTFHYLKEGKPLPDTLERKMDNTIQDPELSYISDEELDILVEVYGEEE